MRRSSEKKKKRVRGGGVVTEKYSATGVANMNKVSDGTLGPSGLTEDDIIWLTSNQVRTMYIYIYTVYYL